MITSKALWVSMAALAAPLLLQDGGSEEPRGMQDRQDGRTREREGEERSRRNPRRPPRRVLPPSLLGGECDAIAFAVQQAAELEAEADYWIALAHCANDPACDLALFEPIALAEKDDAIAEAQEQYEARLEICAALGGGVYAPDVDPAEFSTTVDHLYLPLVPGRRLTYESQTDEGLETTVVRTSRDVRDIGGFLCVAVSDKVSLDGELIEDTVDWFAQRADGSVWYFGEVSKEFEDGLLASLEGSWQTGTDAAQPGIVMLALPAVGDFYRQEFRIGVAEDVALVVALDETVTVPAGTFDHCLQTEDRSPFNPDAIEWKYYAPGVGLVLEVDVDTGLRSELVRIED